MDTSKIDYVTAKERMALFRIRKNRLLKNFFNSFKNLRKTIKEI